VLLDASPHVQQELVGIQALKPGAIREAYEQGQESAPFDEKLIGSWGGIAVCGPEYRKPRSIRNRVSDGYDSMWQPLHLH
jgi:hypothetical protein